jgi:hypothetical protein
MNIHEAWLSGLHPWLASEDVNFNNSLAAALKRFDTALFDIGTRFDQYNEQVKAEKTSEAILEAYDSLQDEIKKLTAKPLSDILMAESGLAKKLTPVYKDTSEERLAFDKAQADLRELSALSPEERRELLRATAEAGNPRILRALQSMLKPGVLIPDVVIKEAQEKYIQTAFPNETKALSMAKEKASSLERAKEKIPFAVEQLTTKRGLGLTLEDALGIRKQKKFDAAKDGMDDAEKAAYIKEHGVEAFKKLHGE